QRIDLEDAPHRLVRVPDLASDRLVSGRTAQADELAFDGVRGREIESLIARGRRRDRLPVRVSRGEIAGERGPGDHFAVAGTPTRAPAGAAAARRPNAIAAAARASAALP